MKKCNLVLALTFLVSAAFGQQNDEHKLTSEFDRLLGEQFRSNETGAAVLVARKGKVIYKKAFGMANLELNMPMQEESIFKIGSITKQFTAIAILQLMEQGKLTLQDAITRFIPDYPMQGKTITIEHLLTHTSGIQDFTSIPDSVNRLAMDYTPKEMVDYFKNQPMRFAPGTKWEYSNSGYFLLGYIIEKITGNSYANYLEQNIFKPLGMTNSQYASDSRVIKNRVDGYIKSNQGFENAPYESMTHPYAAGAIQSTVEDLFKWNQAVHSYKLVKKETLDKALSRYKLTDGKETAYGYGWRLGSVYDIPSIWHGGLVSGFISMETYLPREDVFVTVFSNCQCNSPEVITSRLAALAAGKPIEYKEISMGSADLLQYAGLYENERGQQRIISVSDNKLFMQLGRGPRTQIKPYQIDNFFVDPVLTLGFSRNKTRDIESFTTQSLRGNDQWTRSTKPIPPQDGIEVAENILEKYVGTYQMTPQSGFAITKENKKLFIQPSGQAKLEMFAETETKFFLKVNDAEFEFVKDESGKVWKANLSQGGQKREAKKL
ncbi:MAG: serine hydrolase [Chitinophagaceae bacterium]|nr:serine hydrolase [Chitinophagaceae bacterium]